MNEWIVKIQIKIGSYVFDERGHRLRRMDSEASETEQVLPFITEVCKSEKICHVYYIDLPMSRLYLNTVYLSSALPSDKRKFALEILQICFPLRTQNFSAIFCYSSDADVF